MKKLFLLFFSLFLSACGPDFSVGPTSIIVYEGAEVPCDLADVLFDTYDAIEARYGQDAASETMRITLTLHPRWDPPKSKWTGEDRFNGLYEGDVIKIRILDPRTIMRSAFHHEFISHRLPDVLGNMNACPEGYTCGPNREHAQEWTDIELEITEEVRNKVKNIPCP